MNGVKITRLKMTDYTGAFRCGDMALPKVYCLPDDRIPDVRDQGAVNSCVGFAVTNIMQIFDQIETGTRDRFSAGYVYGRCREDDESHEGMIIPNVLDHLKKVGACKEADFPYNEEMPIIREMVLEHPELDKMAEPYHIAAYEVYAYAMKDKKYQSVKEALYRTQTPILADMDFPGGSHAVCIIGWNDTSKQFRILNSWGEDWKDGGLGSVPYYKLNRGYLLMDAKNTNTMPFSDVAKDAWYYKAIEKVYSAGLMNGVSDTEFEPDREMTRGEMAQVLTNFMSKIDDILNT